MRNPVPRIAAIHDMSGFGRTSLTVAIPILSCMGIQVCPMPTAVLSTHTVEFTDYTLCDLTPELGGILDHWERLGLHFDGVYSGFMASPEQMDSVARCIRNCLAPGADIITPNITEVALLLDEPFTPRISPEEIKGRLRRLSAMGPQTVVATSVPLLEDGRDPGHNASVIAYERDEDRFWRIDCAYIPAHYPGTGDTFSSVLTGSLIQGDSLSIALDRAVQFVTLGIRATFGQGLPSREGILLERILGSLFAPVSACKCRIMDGDGCCNPVLPFED